MTRSVADVRSHAERGNEVDCVVKVGGSLYDLPNLAEKLRSHLPSLVGTSYVVVPGGGDTADVVRAWDACHRLGEEESHWLALRALTLNGHFLAGLIGDGQLVVDAGEVVAALQSGRVPILDAYAFAQADLGQAGELPHCWRATSDALAARVANVMRARELVLLKSVDVMGGWRNGQKVGAVDHYFGDMMAPGVAVRILNWRGNASTKRR